MKNIAAYAPPVRQRGFTLIEVMMAVTIAAILMAIAVPSFQNMIARNRMATVTNDLLAAVQTVRSEAIRLNQNVTLCRVNDSTATTCAPGNWQEWVILDAANNVIRRGRLDTAGTNPRVTSTLAGGSLTFNARGTTTFSGVNNTLDNNEVGTNLFRVCTANLAENNVRRIKIGVAGSVTTYPPINGNITGGCS